MARKGEYELAREALSPFTDGRIFLTPGNHDYGSWGGTDYSEKKAKYFDDPFANTLGFKHPFFDKKVFVHRAAGPVRSYTPNDRPQFLRKGGMEDWAQGEIGEDQRNELADILEQYDAKIPKIIFLHHIPNKAGRFPFAS